MESFSWPGRSTIYNCAKCGIPSDAPCAKCMKTVYCSRECQVTDWPIHKNDCLEYCAFKNICETVIKNILGELYILYANAALGKGEESLILRVEILAKYADITKTESYWIRASAANESINIYPKIADNGVLFPVIITFREGIKDVMMLAKPTRLESIVKKQKLLDCSKHSFLYREKVSTK